MKNGKIESFKDLNVWKEGHHLVLFIYQLTNTFPQEEKYSIVDQMRRSASSITANIAEGFGRQTYKEKVQFYYLSKGSLAELVNFIEISKDLKYLKSSDYEELILKTGDVGKMLHGLISKSKSFINR